MEGQGRKPFFASDHFADFHQVVVNYVCKVVCRQFVSPLPEHLVVEGVGIDLDMAPDKVIHLDYSVLRHLEPDCPVGCLFEEGLYL